MCEYCDERYKEEDLAGDDGVLYDEKRGHYLFIEHFRNEKHRIYNIKYCPMCGRDLIVR